jgi:hypothetical protein
MRKKILQFYYKKEDTHVSRVEEILLLIYQEQQINYAMGCLKPIGGDIYKGYFWTLEENQIKVGSQLDEHFNTRNPDRELQPPQLNPISNEFSAKFAKPSHFPPNKFTQCFQIISGNFLLTKKKKFPALRGTKKSTQHFF